MKPTVTTKTKKTYSVNIERATLIEALQALGIDIPSTAQFSVWVPGGGDWSNTTLVIGEDGDVPLNARWIEREQS